MSGIEQQLKSWNSDERAVGEIVLKRVSKHLEGVLLEAYRRIDPTLQAVPPAVLANERAKLTAIARGDFSPDYFRIQGEIAKNIASSTDYVTYFGGYATYAAGLLSGLLKETGYFASNKDALINSLMKSVFADVCVVIHHYFEEWRQRIEQEKAAVDAERAKAAADDQAVIKLFAEGLAALSNGDLTYRVRGNLPAKGEALRQDFNAAIEKLQEAMKSVAANASAIRAGTGEITTAADNLSKRTEQQAASLEETAAALDEITATVRKTAEGATHARDVVSNAKEDAERSGQVVREAVAAMSEIEKSSQQISQIIGVIDEIAFQTNLLALNAGVEAARAGEAGKGFAVVASEVRALAQRSAEAAKEIKTLISTSTQQVEAGVHLVGETGKALERIVAQVIEIKTVVAEIAASAQEQSTGLHEVNTAVNQMDQVTQQNAAMVEESTAASHNLAQETEELARLVARFNVGVGEPAPARRSTRTPASTPRPMLKTVGRGGAAPKPAPAAQADNWEEF